MPLRQSTPVEMKVGIALAVQSMAKAQSTTKDFIANSDYLTIPTIANRISFGDGATRH